MSIIRGVSAPRTITVALLSEPQLQTQAAGESGTPPVEFGGIAYSGGVVPNYGWAGDMAIDLAGMKLPRAEVPILLNHDPGQIVGRATVANDGSQLVVEHGRFSAVTDAGRQVQGLMQEGHPWSFSVGVNAQLKAVDRTEAVKLNGRSLNVDSVLRDARLLEVSFVPAGADPNAYAAQLSARLGPTPPQSGDTSMSGEDAGRVAELEQQIAQLTAQVATITGERDTARAELAAAAKARRTERLSALFAEGELKDDEREAYLAMTDVQFAAVTAHLGARRADPKLFTQQATAGRNAEGAPVTPKLTAPAGFEIDPERAALHAKALAYQAKHPGTAYLAAVAAAQEA